MEGSPRRFDDRDSARAWLSSTFAPWEASLTAAEQEALSAYKLDAYEPLNEALRFGVDLGDEDEQLVRDLDTALSRFRLPEPVIVFRGFVDPAVQAAAIGREFIDFGYFSTSLLRIVAEDIIGSESQDERVLAQVTVPGGAQIGAFVGAPDLVRDFGELEILLPRESRFRITGRSDAENIELEVIV